MTQQGGVGWGELGVCLAVGAGGLGGGVSWLSLWAEGLWECVATDLARCCGPKDALEPFEVAIVMGWEAGNWGSRVRGQGDMNPQFMSPKLCLPVQGNSLPLVHSGSWVVSAGGCSPDMGILAVPSVVNPIPSTCCRA